jgi:hypothetical protein
VNKVKLSAGYFLQKIDSFKSMGELELLSQTDIEVYFIPETAGVNIKSIIQ